MNSDWVAALCVLRRVLKSCLCSWKRMTSQGWRKWRVSSPSLEHSFLIFVYFYQNSTTLEMDRKLSIYSLKIIVYTLVFLSGLVILSLHIVYLVTCYWLWPFFCLKTFAFLNNEWVIIAFYSILLPFLIFSIFAIPSGILLKQDQPLMPISGRRWNVVYWWLLILGWCFAWGQGAVPQGLLYMVRSREEMCWILNLYSYKCSTAS